MHHVYVACWTMNPTALGAQAGRINTFENIALGADSHLKIMANIRGMSDARILIVPEYVFTAGGTILSRDDKHQIYRQLESISARLPSLIIIAGSVAYQKGTYTYNVCPILYNGRIVKKLYKAADDGVYQNNGTFRTKTDGGKGVPIATINGITIGVDICADILEGEGRLTQYLADHHLARPDIHVQISGSNAAYTPRAAARNGGVYFHCDLGNKGAHGATAWAITADYDYLTGATTNQIAPAHSYDMSAGQLKLFYVQL